MAKALSTGFQRIVHRVRPAGRVQAAGHKVQACAPSRCSARHRKIWVTTGPRIGSGTSLLTVGSLAKPRFWALALAQRLGNTELPVTLAGDGAGGLVEAWAARTTDGTLGVLLWNGTLDHTKAGPAATVHAKGMTWMLRIWGRRRPPRHLPVAEATGRTRSSGGRWPQPTGYRRPSRRIRSPRLPRWSCRYPASPSWRFNLRFEHAAGPAEARR
jgi:hypothetical protein